MSNLKVEGKVGDFCLNCKNCKGITQECNGKTASIRLTEVECVDPYDGMTKTLSADSDICCSMFEPKSDRSCENDIYVTSYMGLYEEKKEKEPCDKISLLQHELEMERLRTKIHQLEKEKAAHLKGIERLKKSQEKLQNQVKNLQTTNEESYKQEEKLKDKYLKKILDQQATHYKQCARILDLENMVSKLQSGEYDDILAKDIEIKSLQDKYEAAMTGWKDAIDTNDKSQSEIDDLIESNENLTKAVERRDKWIGEFQSGIAILNSKIKMLDKRNTNQSVIIGEKSKQIEELTRRYNMIAKKLNDIHDILKEDPNNE